MPALIAVFLVMLSAYQLFFRYNDLPDARHDGVVYEHDSLTGETREIRPGEHVDPLVRILGDGLAATVERGRPSSVNEAFNFSMLDVSKKQAAKDDMPGLRGISDLRQSQRIEPLVPEATGAPVPGNATPTVSSSYAGGGYTAQGIDLNQDGQPEQVIQRVSANDGLVDISIINNGRELFYGRGKKLNILNSRHGGWLDVSLEGEGGRATEYVYRRSMDGYEPVSHDVMTASR